METWFGSFLNIGILVSMLFALMGSLIPIFPGPTVLWGLALAYGLISGFDTRGFIFFGIISILGFTGTIVDNIITAGSAKLAGARWSSILIAVFIGFFASIFFTPIVGIAVTLAVLYYAEYLHHKDSQKAWEATKNMLFGWGWTALARFGIGLLIVLLWSAWVWL
jgi:hypothetical protein